MQVTYISKTWLVGTLTKVRIGKYLSSSFPFEDGLKRGDPYHHFYLMFTYTLLERYMKLTTGANIGLCRDVNKCKCALDPYKDNDLTVNIGKQCT